MISAIHIAALHHRVITFSSRCVIAGLTDHANRKITDCCFARSHRKIADHRIADCYNLSNNYVLFLRCYDMRCRISAIGDFFRFFEYECFLMHAMRWISHRTLAVYHCTHKEISYLLRAMRCFLKEYNT